VKLQSTSLDILQAYADVSVNLVANDIVTIIINYTIYCINKLTQQNVLLKLVT